jgi:hypothetical protein
VRKVTLVGLECPRPQRQSSARGLQTSNQIRPGWPRAKKELQMLKRYMIERDIPGVGKMNAKDLGQAAQTSNGALAKLKGVQWEHSYVTGNKTFCIYLAENEDVIREHAKLSGFPATKITEIGSIIDPTTELQCKL